MLINLTRMPVQLMRADGSRELLLPSPQHEIFNNVHNTAIHDPNGLAITIPTAKYRNNINSTVIVDSTVIAQASFNCNVILASDLMFGVYTKTAYIKVNTSEELAREKTNAITKTLVNLVDACGAFGNSIRRQLEIDDRTPEETDLIMRTTINRIDSGNVEILINYLKDNNYVKYYLREVLDGGVR